MCFKWFSIHLVNGCDFICECIRNDTETYALWFVVIREVERLSVVCFVVAARVLLGFCFDCPFSVSFSLSLGAIILFLRPFSRSVSCLFILQHNCGWKTISMRAMETKCDVLYGGCNGLLIRPSNIWQRQLETRLCNCLTTIFGTFSRALHHQDHSSYTLCAFVQWTLRFGHFMHGAVVAAFFI